LRWSESKAMSSSSGGATFRRAATSPTRTADTSVSWATEEELVALAVQHGLAVSTDNSDVNNAISSRGLPLEIFDTEPEAIKLYLEDIPVVGTVAAPSFRAPRAFAFVKGHAPCGRFTACSVLQRRKNCKSLFVEVCGSGEKMWVPRVAVLLKQDSAPSFMRRFALAVKANSLAEANLRYNLYLDNMPTDEVAPLPADVIAIMSRLACNSKASDRMLDSDYLKSVLIPEVCRDYVRSVNRSIFDLHRSDEGSPQYQQYAAARLPPLPNKAAVPEYGLIACEPVQIQATKMTIDMTGCHFSCAAVKAMQRVRHECQKMMAIGFFQVDLTKTLKLPDFKRLQAEASKFGTSTLK